MSGHPSPVRLGVVGAGAIARTYAELLAPGSGRDAVRTTGVVDLDPLAAAEWAARVGCRALTDPVALLDRQVEAVVLCTPPSTHAPLAELFAEHGVAVLCEKPLSTDAATAAAMAETASRHGALLAMAAKFRFCADVRRAGAMVELGAIGRVQRIEVSFTSRSDMRDRWNSRPAISGGGVVIDNGTHAVDLVTWIAGPVRDVLATEPSRLSGQEVEDTARLELRTERGVDATVELSWNADAARPDFLRVLGTGGELRVGWQTSVWRTNGGEWQTIGTGYSKHEAMGGALDQFVRAVRGIEAPEVPALEAARTAAVIDAAYRSLGTGRRAAVMPVRHAVPARA